MSFTAKKQTGFTIVELLIVVVVIAILAAISVVAYAGIQNRANDSAVQSDINNFVTKIKLYQVEEGMYPIGGDTSAPTGIDNFSVARAAYKTDGTHNFMYCRGSVAGQPAFSVGAISKSGARYYYSSLNSGIQVYSGDWGEPVNTICSSMLPGFVYQSRSYGYNHQNQLWFSWTQ